MRLLICTQIVDRRNAQLGFFHRWIEEIAHNVEEVSVICLKEGEHALPSNVRVYSLGKEHRVPTLGKLAYSLRFWRFLWRLRGSYDTVFVHMNQEYALLGGPPWRLFQKRVFLWRNHYSGSFLTDIAAVFCHRVFCTSRSSYTMKYKKTVRMPVGVDVGSCRDDEAIERTPHSVLFLSRFDESKRPHRVVEALHMLAQKGVSFSATFVGGPGEHSAVYFERVTQDAAGLEGRVVCTGAVPNTETYRYYRSHEIYVNASPSGMLDKTMFKAAACGCLVVSSSRDMAEMTGGDFSFEDDSAEDLARHLERALALSKEERQRIVAARKQSVVEEHRLDRLIKKLVKELSV
jgi:glycosyltransferase involved in cell wall biosynthesis